MFRNSVLANSNHNTDPSIINTDTPLTMDHETASAGNQKISEILSYKSTQMYGQRRTFMDSALHYLFGSLSKSIRVLFIIYIIVSLVYTFAHFFTLFHRGQQSTVDTIPSSQSLLQEGQTVVGKIVLDKQPLDSPAGENTADTVLTGRFSLVAEANSSPQTGFSLASLKDVPNNMLISKLFQYALQPTTIIPYYLKMNNNPSHSEITITTMITIERLGVFSGLVNKYRGPISVTLHLKDDEEKLSALEYLHEVLRNNPLFAEFVDLHLVVDNYDRQFNLWRNIARLFARTDLIMTIDVDFMLCSDLKQNYLALDDAYKQMLLNGSAVFVVPAFELAKEAAEMDAENYPALKTDLIKLIEQKDVTMFHDKWQRGHGPTDYARWYQTTTEPYRVTEYNYNYEPYVLMKREGLPWCDERFVGYGANKAACLYEIYMSGAQFWVMPQDFLIHQRHPYPENDRRVERKYNKRLYDAYREETCLRYGRMMRGVSDDGALDERICGANFPSFHGL